MSHQPSTVDEIKNTANSAYDSITNTVTPKSENEGSYDPNKDKTNFAKDTQQVFSEYTFPNGVITDSEFFSSGNTFKKGDLKDKLNEAANGGPRKAEESYVEKGVSAVQQPKDQKSETGINKELPPKRPEHDVQVEEFLRKQYHSAAGDGMPDPDKKQG